MTTMTDESTTGNQGDGASVARSDGTGSEATGSEARALVAEIRLVEPLLGFEEHLVFDLSDIDPAGILLSLRSQADPGLRFVLTRPERFFADYAPALEPVMLSAVGAADPAGVTVFVILTIGTGLADATANLRAPLVVAEDTGRAVQVVLDEDTLSMKQPLVS